MCVGEDVGEDVGCVGVCVGVCVYHSVDMNGAISLVNSLKRYFRITQVTSNFQM